MRLLLLAASATLLPAAEPRFAGAPACAGCHPSQSTSQSTTGHAGALSRVSQHPLRSAFALQPAWTRAPGFRIEFRGPEVHISDARDVLVVPLEWAFGAGDQAVTFVSRADSSFHLEHYLSYYTALKKMAPTPGQAVLRPANLAEAAGLLYKNTDPKAGILGCFECHSTGSVKDLIPSEPGVHCEACHGPGSEHASTAGKSPMNNPRKLDAGALNRFCGRCHRPPASDPATIDWNYAWNVRHQPVYLSQSACFRSSRGALSCLTCHEPHSALRRDTAYYDARCVSCHKQRSSSCKPAGCAGCHMPRVSPEPPLHFTNHWIGVYREGAMLRPR